MKTLLIQPPIEDFYRTRFREYPLGLLYLAASLRAGGHQAELLDARYCKKGRSVALPETFGYLAGYYGAGNGLFGGFRRFGIDYHEIGEMVGRARPDAVFVNAMFTPYSVEVKKMSATVKKVFPECRIIAGGHHATADPDDMISSGVIDSVVRGEGEEVVLDAMNGGRIIYEGAGGQPFRVDDLDSLPFPARDIVRADMYLYNKRPYTMILTSRGCPHRCSFCSVQSLSGHTYRKRSVQNVIYEIDECIKKYGIRVFDFQDDNLLYDPLRIKEMLLQIQRLYGGYGLELMASNGLNAAHIDEELLYLMRRAGFRKLDIALAAGDVASRKNLRRPESVEKYENILEAAVKEGLSVTTYIILGLPFQPISEMRETVEYLKKKPTLISPSIFYNVPGMPMYEEARQFEYAPVHAARRSSAFNCFGKDFTRDDIFALFKEIREYNTKIKPPFCGG